MRHIAIAWMFAISLIANTASAQSFADLASISGLRPSQRECAQTDQGAGAGLQPDDGQDLG